MVTGQTAELGGHKPGTARPARSHRKLGKRMGRILPQPPELGENEPLLSKPFGVWSFIRGALGNAYHDVAYTYRDAHRLSVTPH